MYRCSLRGGEGHGKGHCKKNSSGQILCHLQMGHISQGKAKHPCCPVSAEERTGIAESHGVCEGQPEKITEKYALHLPPPPVACLHLVASLLGPWDRPGCPGKAEIGYKIPGATGPVLDRCKFLPGLRNGCRHRMYIYRKT